MCVTSINWLSTWGRMPFWELRCSTMTFYIYYLNGSSYCLIKLARLNDMIDIKYLGAGRRTPSRIDRNFTSVSQQLLTESQEAISHAHQGVGDSGDSETTTLLRPGLPEDSDARRKSTLCLSNFTTSPAGPSAAPDTSSPTTM